MKQKRLRWRLVTVVIACWLVPVLLVLGVMGWHMVNMLDDQARLDLQNQLDLNTAISMEQLDSAIIASRRASYDFTIKNAWQDYQNGKSFSTFYREVKSFMDQNYFSDARFRFAVFHFFEPGQTDVITIPNSAVYDEVLAYQQNGAAGLLNYAKELDTAIGFYQFDGRIYLVRNVMSTRLNPIGTLVLPLNHSYFFENLRGFDWAQSLKITLGNTELILRESIEEDALVRSEAVSRDFRLVVEANVNIAALMRQFNGYYIVLAALICLLIPMLVYVFFFFNKNVTIPIRRLRDSSVHVAQGDLGYQLAYQAPSLEFQEVINSFNSMSSQLQRQFDQLYKEELSARDARIKALQSHINPHFLNNTLEIINWEARMSGADKVSQMIEALSTLLDAAIARDRRTQISLEEELAYCDAYLYIVRMRFGERITIEQDIDADVLDCMVPRLILQPVIENAVEHGEDENGQRHISTRGYRRGGKLILEIENSGELTEQDKARIQQLLSPEYDQARSGAVNIGIANVHQRLVMLYSGESGLVITQGSKPHTVLATVTIELGT